MCECCNHVHHQVLHTKLLQPKRLNRSFFVTVVVVVLPLLLFDNGACEFSSIQPTQICMGGLSEEPDRLEGGLERCLSSVEPSFPPLAALRRLDITLLLLPGGLARCLSLMEPSFPPCHVEASRHLLLLPLHCLNKDKACVGTFCQEWQWFVCCERSRPH